MEIRENGALIHDEVAIGDIAPPVAGDPATLTIDLGWAKAAGLRIIVRDDPAIDHHRRGILLDRG